MMISVSKTQVNFWDQINKCCDCWTMQKWPLKSDLDPSLYGPQESKITTEIVEQQLKAYDYTLAEVHNTLPIIYCLFFE